MNPHRSLATCALMAAVGDACGALLGQKREHSSTVHSKCVGCWLYSKISYTDPDFKQIIGEASSTKRHASHITHLALADGGNGLVPWTRQQACANRKKSQKLAPIKPSLVQEARC